MPEEGHRATGKMWLALLGMTLASSMILVDQTAVPLASPDVVIALQADLRYGPWILTANILPLAACLVLGGRVADVVGLRKAFVVAAAAFALATVLAGTAQNLPWMISARVLQGLSAAIMMPATVAITSMVWPKERRGFALGILAGASACFAAAGPVLGGLLTALDWRLVFFINVPLAVTALILALVAVPPTAPAGRLKEIDWIGGVLFAVAMVGLVLALTSGQPDGWASPQTLVPVAVAVVAAIVFVQVERRATDPLIHASLFRRLNFTASTFSQLIAGMLELGLGYLLPFYLLLVIGVGPVAAGLALIPGTIPIILAGPLAGRLFDRIGGRLPLTVGFGVLALSGIALGIGVGGGNILSLLPGLVLQGIGLGIVLTVNDPVGMNALDDSDQGQGAGIINTAEQVGGAIGIAALSALQLGYYWNNLFERLSQEGISPTNDQVVAVHNFIALAEQRGMRNTPQEPVVRRVYEDLVEAHAASFQFTFFVSAGIAAIGAIVCWLLVRRDQRTASGPIFSRRSRWQRATPGGIGQGVTRLPPSAASSTTRSES
jgi:EmrB/QacA subfamily drug resistance transporter